MRDRLDEFGDAAVVVIAFSAPEHVARYQREELAPLPVLIDTDRSVFEAYGMRRGSLAATWGPRTWLAYARLLRRGRRFRRPRDDTLQLGGDVVIDRDGRIAFAYRSSEPDDRPTVDDLLAAIVS